MAVSQGSSMRICRSSPSGNWDKMTRWALDLELGRLQRVESALLDKSKSAPEEAGKICNSLWISRPGKDDTGDRDRRKSGIEPEAAKALGQKSLFQTSSNTSVASESRLSPSGFVIPLQSLHILRKLHHDFQHAPVLETTSYCQQAHALSLDCTLQQSGGSNM